MDFKSNLIELRNVRYKANDLKVLSRIAIHDDDIPIKQITKAGMKFMKVNAKITWENNVRISATRIQYIFIPLQPITIPSNGAAKAKQNQNYKY